MRRIWSLLVTLSLLTACSRPAATPSAAPPQLPVDPPAASADGPKAESVLPPADRGLTYDLSDEPKRITEYFVRDGERLTGTQDGKPYVTWFITDQGVYRQDSQGPGLLRYLPPVLKDGTAWRQHGGSGDVWFRLRQSPCIPQPTTSCWELTALNGSVRSQFQFNELRGLVWASVEDLTNPVAGFEKELVGDEKSPAPDRAAIVKQMPTRPDAPLPPVSAVSLADFAATERALLSKSGWLSEIDLDNDGKPERIEGKLGLWTPAPLAVYANDGRRLLHPGYSVHHGWQHKLVIGQVAGVDRPALILQSGTPDRWHETTPLWLYPDGLHNIYGWQPKVASVWSGDARIEPDGALFVTGIPQLMAGYQWSRRYRLQHVGDQYQPELISEQMTAGPYPTAPDDLLTAAFIARRWNLAADLARYIPAEEVQRRFQAAALSKQPYHPEQVQTGKVSYSQDGYPTITAAPLAPDRSTEFLDWDNGYEGGAYYAGTAQFGQAADGRLIITQLAITHKGFCYDRCSPLP